MANYPFKINIQFKDGSTKPHYTSSFATDAETSLSASAMVDKINLIPLGDAYTQDNVAVAMHGSRKFGLDDEGHKWISASYTHANTGSVVFTDTEDTDNGGLDFYTFWGTKVCNVLGLPEGIPIYTENFKLSDDSSNPSNYLSGDVIADGVAIKESFKLAPQARMRSNLVWDHQFGEGFLQWVSGSASKLLFGYDDQADTFLLSSAAAATFNITGVTSLGATSVSAGSVATDLIYDSGDLDIVAGGTSFDRTNQAEGQIHLGYQNYNEIIGNYQFIYNESDKYDGTADSGANINNFPINFHNDYTAAIGRYSGISFQQGGDPYHPLDNADNRSPMGAITVHRTSDTLTNRTGLMRFSLNDGTGNDASITSVLELTSTGSIFNDTGESTQDFRVESNTYPNMFFVNAGTNQVSINSDTTSSPFEGDADRDFKHDSPFTVFSGAEELGGTTNDTVGMATFGYENTGGNGAYLEFFGRRNTTGTDWTTSGTRIQHVIDNVGQGYIEFNGEAGSYGMSLGTSASGTSANAYISSPGIILDGDGHVTKPRNPAFHVVKTSDQTDGVSTGHMTCSFQSEILDIGGNFASNTFTAPVDGIYYLHTHLDLRTVASTTYYIWPQIETADRRFLGSLARISDIANSQVDYYPIDCSAIAEMTAGDTAFVRVQSNNAGTAWVINGAAAGADGVAYSYFEGYLLG